MFKSFFKILFMFLFLELNIFFVFNDIEASSKIKFSEKYSPQFNPCGSKFYEDEDFVKSYKLYEKRREFLRKKRLEQGLTRDNLNRKNLAKILKKKDVDLLDNSIDIEEADKEDVMINYRGVDIARLKGAIFMEDNDKEKNNDNRFK